MNGPQTIPEEANWISAAQGGDLEAFSLLMQRYENRIVRFLWRRLGNGSDAEDVAQEVFIKAFRKLHRFEPSRPFGPWIFTLARRESASFLRRRRLVSLSVWVKKAPAPDQSLQLTETRDRIWKLAREILKPDPFSALWLSVESEASIAEIASTLSKSDSAVKVMLHRARKQLSEALQAIEPSGLTETQTDWEYVHHETRL